MTEQKHVAQQDLALSADDAAVSTEIRVLSLDELLAVAGGPTIENENP